MSDRFRILYYVVLFYWRHLFGDGEFALRSLSSLFGVLVASLTYFTALKPFGKKHALWSFLLIAISSYCVFYAQEARDYAMLMLIVSCQLLFIVHQFSSLEGGLKLKYKLMFAFFTQLGILANIVMVLFSLSLAIAHLLVSKRFKSWISWWIPSVLLSIPSVIFYLSSPMASNPESIGASRVGFPVLYNAAYVLYGLLAGITFGPPQEQLKAANKLPILLEYLPQLSLFLIATLLTGILLFQSQSRKLKQYRKNKEVESFLVYSLVLSFASGILFAVVTKINWLPRHAFFIWPFLALLLPVIISSKSEKNAANSRIVYGYVALSLVAFMNLWSLYNYYYIDSYYKDDFRSATQYIISHREKGTSSVLVGGAGNNRLLEYYGDPTTLDGRNLKEPNGDGKFSEGLSRLTNNSSKVMVVVNREYFFGSPGTLEADMKHLYQFTDKTSFKYFNIYHFRKAS